MIVPRKFSTFPHFPRNSEWCLATKSNKKKSFWRKINVFFQKRELPGVPGAKKSIKEKGLWRKTNVFLIGGREYIAHHTKSRFYISYLKDCSLVHSFTILFEFGFHLINLSFSHVFKLNRLTAHRRCNCIDTDL